MQDEDMVNLQNKESYQYSLWEREQKNKILAMHDVQKKQSAWQRLFPVVERNDEWILSATVF